MENAKDELLSEIDSWVKIKCASIYKEYYDYDKPWYNNIMYELPVNYTDEQYKLFLESLDFNYDNWYWWQNLFWYVWLEDWTRLDRWEYDWSERRNHQNLPDIPEHLKNENTKPN